MRADPFLEIGISVAVRGIRHFLGQQLPHENAKAEDVAGKCPAVFQENLWGWNPFNSAVALL